MNLSSIDNQSGRARRILAYSAIGAMIVFSNFSHAYESDVFPGELEFSNEDWPAVEVTGSNGVYTQTVGVAYTWQVHMHMDPGGADKVISWEVWPSVSNTQDLVPGKPVGPDLKSAMAEKSYPWRYRPDEVTGTIGKTITTELQPWSVQQCNDLVQSLKDAGMDASEIHGIDRVLAVEWQAHATTKVTSSSFSFGSSNPYSTPMQSTITCKSITPPSEVVGSDDISLPVPDFELIDTDLSVFYTASAQCPKDILVSSNTRTNIPGQFTLWYEIQSANAGNLKSVDYALASGTASDAGLWAAPHMDTFQVPLSGLSNAGGGQGPVHAVGASDLLPGVGAGGSGTGSGSPSAADDFNNAATTPVNQHSGKIRAVAQHVGAVQGGSPGGLVGEPAAQTVFSAWKDYLVVCEYDAEPVIGNLPSDMTADMDHQPSQSAAIPGLGNKITGVSGQVPAGRGGNGSKRMQQKMDELSRQQEIRDKTAKRNLQAAVKARRLKAEAEARRKAMVAAQQAAEKKRRAALEAEQKKVKAKALAEAKRKALIAKQETEAAKRQAAIEARKKQAAKKNNRPRRLNGKKPGTGLQAMLRRHSN